MDTNDNKEVVEQYHINGQLSLKGKSNNGIMDGPYEKYYENGKIYKEEWYKNDRVIYFSLFLLKSRS